MSASSHRDQIATCLTLTLSGISVAGLELALCQMEVSAAITLARIVGWLTVMVVGFVILATVRPNSGSSLPISELIGLIVVTFVPFLWHPIRVTIFGGGFMLETVLLESLRNLGLGLAVLSSRQAACRLATILALFGIMVGSCLVEGPVMTAMAASFAVLGAGWLVANYWSGLPKRVELFDTRPPWTGFAAILVVAATVPAVALIGPATVVSVLFGMMPTSGGADWPDEQARSGVGDGPNEIDARDSAESVGFTQSDLYLETDQPSLYDAFSDTFGEPFKKTKQDKAIALEASDVQQRQRHPSEDLRAGREFSTYRRPPTRRDPPDEEADALLYVQGPTRAHLRLVAYDQYDGRAWIEGLAAPTVDRGISLEDEESPWLQVDNSYHAYLSGRVRHRIKVALLKTEAIPSTAHVHRFRVGSVNRLDFFKQSQPGLLAMAGRTIPAGTVIETEAGTPSPARLYEIAIPERQTYAHQRYTEIPELNPEMTNLASSWTEGLPKGWQQVESVISHLRGHCVFDRSVTPPQDCPDVLTHFLVESRRGPDYLFATSAALMLRWLGYPTRVVGGLYVNPDRYDVLAKHVAVTTEDAHLWVEVQVPGGGWVAVEPTPGFELMPPALNLIDRFWAGLQTLGRWSFDHALELVMLLVGTSLLVWQRRAVLDRLWTVAWSITARSLSPSRLILATLRLLERRSSWAGRPRMASETPVRWSHAVVEGSSAADAGDLCRLVQLAQWAAFFPGPLPDDTDPTPLCRRVVQHWNMKALRTSHSSDPSFSRRN